VSDQFRKRLSGPRLSTEQAVRQGRISQLAFVALGQAGAIAFLNGHDDELGGRPLDLAVKSAEGLAAVEYALSRTRAAG
jgi:hypothetical protein